MADASTRLDLERLKLDRECGQALSGREVDLLLAEVERLRSFARLVVEAGEFDFTDATLYEWVCDLHDTAVALLDDREATT